MPAFLSLASASQTALGVTSSQVGFCSCHSRMYWTASLVWAVASTRAWSLPKPASHAAPALAQRSASALQRASSLCCPEMAASCALLR